MRNWKVVRLVTFNDDELAAKLNTIESQPGCKVKEVVYIGDNPQHIRIYQIIFVEDY